jgi:hypothetical protein
MSDAYVIEVRSAPAGLVVRDRGRFRFFAATDAFLGLDGRTFRNPQEAERAAVRHVDARIDRSAPPAA